MLTTKECAALLAGRFVLKYREMKVHPFDSSTEPEFEGRGQVAQAADGLLEFKLSGSISLPEVFVWSNQRAGVPIAPEQMPTFTGVDSAGRAWSGEQVGVEAFSSNHRRSSAAGRIQRLRMLVPSMDARPSLRLLIPGPITLPVTRWEFMDGEVHVRFVGAEGGVEVIAKAKGPLPDGYDSRIEEALWFVFGSLNTAVVVERPDADSIETIICPQRFVGRGSRLGGPLRALPRNAEAMADMFVRYLNYAKGGPLGEFHSTSADLRKVHSASLTTIEQEVLSVAVAVESFVRREHQDKGAPASDIATAVEAIGEYVSTWPGNPEVRQRTLGCIRLIGEPNPRSALKELAKAGPLRPEHFEAWEKTRHSSAHGVRARGQDIGLFLRRATLIYQALQLLILDRIGYQGPITDRTVTGWPTIPYPLSTRA